MAPSAILTWLVKFKWVKSPILSTQHNKTQTNRYFFLKLCSQTDSDWLILSFILIMGEVWPGCTSPRDFLSVSPLVSSPPDITCWNFRHFENRSWWTLCFCLLYSLQFRLFACLNKVRRHDRPRCTVHLLLQFGTFTFIFRHGALSLLVTVLFAAIR